MERFTEHQTFGPPSKPISIRQFLKDAQAITTRTESVLGDLRGGAPTVMQVDGDDEELEFEPIPADMKPTIEAECSMDDLNREAMNIMSDTKLLDFIREYHETWRSDSNIGPLSSKVKGKQKASVKSDFDRRLLDLTTKTLKEDLDLIKLQSWKTPSFASFYTRPIQNGDRNTLTSLRTNPFFDEEPLSLFDPDEPTSVALITYSHYSRATLHPYQLRNTSQHVILSHQTLGDIWDNLPCDRKVLPVKSGTGQDEGDDPAAVTYQMPEESSQGAAICVEDIVYGDGLSTSDYSDKVREYVNWKGPGLVKRGGLMHDAKLSDLELRLHQPYWILHQGDCDHIIILTQIRLPHPTDPTKGYPLQTQRAPVTHPICRICNEFAAELSITGDVRIGEPVAPVCRACWKALGDPVTGTDGCVVVVPLVREGLI